MKQSFLSFALGYVLSVLLGLGLAVLHTVVCGGIFAIFVPQSTSPWELGKLAFWPLIVVGVTLPGPWTQGVVRCVIATVAMVFLGWLCQVAGGSGAVWIVLWMAVLAVTLSLPAMDGQWWWLLAVVVLALSYGVLSYSPALWGPFLDPADVAAMAVIPY